MTDLVGLINGAPTSSYVYAIGPVTSADGGATLTPGAAAVISKGAGGSWESSYVKDPALVRDGTQLVCYYAGYNGTQFRIGRATATSVDGTWTKYASNPIIGFGGVGDPDEDGAEFPVPIYEPSAPRPWKMWYAAYPDGATPGAPGGVTIAFADSLDGIAWTKRGRVLNVGTAGQFDDFGLIPGCVIKVGSTYYLYYTGFRSNLLMHSGYATCTDPADSGTYVRGGAIAGFTGNITAAGVTWQSNVARSIVPSSTGSGYRVFGTLWNPTPVDTEEVTFSTTASSLTTWTVPSSLAFTNASWYLNSGENPSVTYASLPGIW
jgi:hypothetical protein